MNKVFCIGFHKTGTNSIEIALKHLGYRVERGREDLLSFIQVGDFDPIRKVVEAYDAFRDNPWPILYRELDLLFPGSKFILTVRDETSWLKSAVNHFGTTHNDMHLHIYGKAFPIGSEEIYLRRYQQHNREVAEYFAERPADLLILDIEDENAWNKLATFLGVPSPNMRFPHANKGVYSRFGKFIKKVRKKIRGIMRQLKLRND